jgi:hypothetical protein
MIRMGAPAMVASGALCVLLCAPAFAQAPAPAAASAKAPQGGAASSEAGVVFGRWDNDHNHVLSLAEFQQGWKALRRAGEIQARLHGQFQAVDANHNDAIEAGEYASLALVKRAGASAQPLSTFDRNRDQRLEFDEYVELVRRMVSSQAATPAPRKAP